MRFQSKRLQSVCLKLSLAAGLLLAACGPSFSAQKPAGFVEIEQANDVYDYRVSTAKGVVIAVREIDNEAEGEAEFWLTAIKDQMREQGGYALIESVAVKSGDGVPGTQLRFGHDDGNNNPHLYYLTVFVTEPTIWLVEAGGTKELVTKEQAKIDQAIAGFRTR
jgi:hypothetical protein